MTASAHKCPETDATHRATFDFLGKAMPLYLHHLTSYLLHPLPTNNHIPRISNTLLQLTLLKYAVNGTVSPFPTIVC